MALSNMNPVCNANKNVGNFFSPLIKILFLFGIDLKLEQDKKSKFIKTNCRILLWHFVHTLLLVSFIYQLCKSDNFYKRFIVRKFVEINVICLWYVIYFKRISIIQVMITLTALSKDIGVPPPKLLKTTGLALVFIVFLGGTTSVCAFENQGRLIAYAETIFPALYIPSNSLHLMAIVIIQILIQYFYIHMFLSLLSLLYCIFCSYLQKILIVYSKKVSSIVRHSTSMDDAHFDCILKFYERISYALDLVENSMSLGAFLLQLTHSVGIFYFLIRVGDEGLSSYSSPKIIFSISHTAVSYLGISYFAAGVNKADKEVKDNLSKLFKQLLMNGRTIDVKKVTSLFLTCSQQPHVLSGWGVIFFSRQFILAGIGNILTYSLLLVQVNKTSQLALT